jgi:hypothetical protein
MTYKEFCKLKSNDPMKNIFPKGTDYAEAMDILQETFLGKNWYISYPAHNLQANTEIVGEILHKYEKIKQDVKIKNCIIIILCIIIFILM